MDWHQLRAILWLRWRLACNQWSRGGAINAVITAAFMIGVLCLGLAGGVAGLVAGAFGLAQLQPRTLMFVWDGLTVAFLGLWTIGLVAELQRSELIDLTRLLHLPVSLRDVFLLNYLCSCLSVSLGFFLPAMLGLAVGLVPGCGPRMLLLLPLVFGFFFMVTAWTDWLRGWLASLMVNQRRRRAIVMGLTLVLVLLAQLPNLVSNVWMRQFRSDSPNRPPSQATGKERRRELQAEMNAKANATREFKAKVNASILLAHQVVPFLWLPGGARSLAEGHFWPALGGAAGMIGLGALGFRRAYLATLRFYRGADSSQPSTKHPVVNAVIAPGATLVERALPWIPEEAAAWALASFRSMTRAPEVKMALAMNVVIFLIMGAGLLVGGSHSPPEPVKPFLAVAAVAVTFLGLIGVLFNQFGFDRDGFRALVLLPAPRTYLLLGKNLALLPMALTVFSVVLALLTVLVRLPLWAVLSALLEFAAGFLALSALGNLFSVLVPYRIAAGSLKPTKTKATVMLLMMLVNLSFPLAMAPLVLPPGLGALCHHLGWGPAAPVTLAGSALLLVASAVLYWAALAPLGALLQRREQKILERVTQEVE